MYSFTLKNVLNISKSLYSKRLRSSNLLFSNSILVEVHKILPCISYNLFKHYSVEPIERLPKDPNERKKFIDAVAQRKIDDILKDPAFLTKKKIIELEIISWRDEGDEVPSIMRPRDWIDIIKLNSRFQRKKFLRLLFINEVKRKKMLKFKEERNKGLEDYKNNRTQVNGDEIEYGIGNNFLIRRITPTSMNKLYLWNCMKGHMFGNKIVFDCSFGNLMNSHETKSCAKQFLECYAANRHHDFPFDVHLCNVDLSSDFIQILYKLIPTLFDKDFPINISTKSYVELFDKKQLVYLSSNSNVELTKYDPNAVYIIGAYVDKGNKQPISRAKAMENHIQCVKLPLDKYIRFGDGSNKDLTLNQVYNIMLDLQIKDWKTALKHVPPRKYYQNRILSLENKVKKGMFPAVSMDEVAK